MSRWMKWRSVGATTAALAILAFLTVDSQVDAATVTHIYDLNGSFADGLGGPAMVGAGGSLGPTGYSFASNPGQGPNLSNAINPSTLLLLSTGLAGLIGYGSRRRREFKRVVKAGIRP